jgi:hypothetical protein
LEIFYCFSQVIPQNCSVFNFHVHVAVVAIDFAAMIMTAIMIYHIKSKYTAVGNNGPMEYDVDHFRSEGNGHVFLPLLCSCLLRIPADLKHCPLYFRSLFGIT